jgi:aminoglycoside/choline kinase family phosphotransferase
MNLNLDELTVATREQFPDQNGSLCVDPIVRGGSERSFTRVTGSEGWKCVLVHYSPNKAENGLYSDIARFLDSIGVRVPKVLAEDRSRRLIWLEDLGGNDLHAFQHRPWAERRAAYSSALEAVGRLHRDGPKALSRHPLPLMTGFSNGTYEWEHEYFLTQFVKAACGLTLDNPLVERASAQLNLVMQSLRSVPETLLHRDFQSQNVMMLENEACLIDFQGMRFGPSFYDLGSLLYDPYVTFTHVERMELLEVAMAQAAHLKLDRERFEKLFYFGAVQRLVQALGAYGFLGLTREKTEFLQYIPAGLRHLRDAARRTGQLGDLLEFVESIENSIVQGTSPISRFGLSV